MSTCTNVMRSWYAPRTSRSSSSTGPQYIDVHKAGVANNTAVGRPVPITFASDTSCNGHCGTLVQIGFTPSVSLGVGEAARGAASPGTGAIAVAGTVRANF